MSDDLPKPARRENTAAVDAPDPRIRPKRILSLIFPASFVSLACTVFLIVFLLNGKWSSMFRLFSQGIVVLLFILRKDAVPLFTRP